MEREKIDVDTVVLVLSQKEHLELRAILEHYNRQVGHIFPAWGAKARRLLAKVEEGMQ